MSDASPEGSTAQAKVGSRLGANILRGIAIIAVLAVGGAAAKYIMAIERPVPKAGHDHGSDKDEHGKEEHGHGAHEGHGHGPEKMIVKLNPIQLKNARLTIEPAASGIIREAIILNGIVQPNEEQMAAVLPRFGGVVRSVTKRLGEPVRKGEVVAKIESNESLTFYDIAAPISGTVIERKGVLGEYADKDKRLMVIADLTTLWVDFRVYQQDFPKLKLEQPVEVALNGTQRASRISYISPIGMTDTQSMLARAIIDNSDAAFRPGLYVNGRVQVGEEKVPVAVKHSTIQYVNGKPVIFVETKEGFEAREVEFGLKDAEMVEVIFGIVAGEKVVTGNSFVLKAELGKGEASHEH